MLILDTPARLLRGSPGLLFPFLQGLQLLPHGVLPIPPHLPQSSSYTAARFTSLACKVLDVLAPASHLAYKAPNSFHSRHRHWTIPIRNVPH